MPRQLAALGAVAVLAILLLGYLAAPPQSPAAPFDVLPGAPAASVASPLALLPVAGDLATEPPATSAASASVAPPATDGREPRPVALGAFIPGAASDPSRIDAYARLVGAVPRIVMWYQAWVGQWNAFAPKVADAIRARGAMPMVSWEPTAGQTVDPRWSLRTIVDGSHDAYIRSWLTAIARWGHPIYVRPMYEMNGWWAPWCAKVNGNSAADFVAAWRHIVDIGRRVGATNVRWVWSPNVDSDGLGVPFASLYPGDDAVDWVALDGFNRGTSWPTTSWVTTRRIFGGSISRLRQFTAKPLMIAETGSSEAGGDKATWIREQFARIPMDFPDVRAIVWFDKHETVVGIDWRVDSSHAALEAFRAAATSKAFSGELP